LIEENIRDRQRFIWLVDPLGILSNQLQNLFPEFAIHIYANPIDFRLFYEPLRERLEEGKPANAIVISKSEKEVPPDVRRYSPLSLHIKPSLLFPSLHPILDDILVSGKLVERFAPFWDNIPRGREETIRFVLGTLLETAMPSSPSSGNAFLILLNYHNRGSEVPISFLYPYLAPLQEKGFSPEELFERENFLDLLRQLLLAWIERRGGVQLEGFSIEERVRELISSIKLELGGLGSEVWRRIDWQKIAKEIPFASIPSLISSLLPEEFYSEISERLIEQLSRNRNEANALAASERLREEGRASEKLVSLLELVKFIGSFSIPSEGRGWLELGRKIALQWRNVKKSLPHGSPLHKEWERLLDLANTQFGKFVLGRYPQWIKGKPRPTLSCDILDEAVLPYLRRGVPVYLLVMDGMTYAQWAVMEDKIRGELRGYKFEDRGCFSILPSTTIFSRNAIFAGALPRDIAKRYGMGYLSNNEGEEEMLRNWLREKLGRGKQLVYYKGSNWDEALREKGDLKAFLLRFTDEITHLTGRVAESEEELLSFVETAYQFRPFSALISAVKEDKAVLVITSDHGSIWVQRTERLSEEEHEEAEGRSNRYYQLGGRSERGVKEALYLSEDKAADWGLPPRHYLIAHGYFMFSRKQYPNKIAVHGGISLWEMCVPLAVFIP